MTKLIMGPAAIKQFNEQLMERFGMKKAKKHIPEAMEDHPLYDTVHYGEIRQMSTQGHPRFHELIQEIAALHNAKNRDYSEGGREGPLGNFIRTSEFKRRYPGFDWTSPFGTAMDFMLKQLDAAFMLYAKRGESVTGEPISARLVDVAVYALLGIILYEDEQKQNSNCVKGDVLTEFNDDNVPIYKSDYGREP